MVIFHSYVSLPEGTYLHQTIRKPGFFIDSRPLTTPTTGWGCSGCSTKCVLNHHSWHRGYIKLYPNFWKLWLSYHPYTPKRIYHNFGASSPSGTHGSSFPKVNRCESHTVILDHTANNDLQLPDLGRPEPLAHRSWFSGKCNHWLIGHDSQASVINHIMYWYDNCVVHTYIFGFNCTCTVCILILLNDNHVFVYIKYIYSCIWWHARSSVLVGSSDHIQLIASYRIIQERWIPT